MGKAAPKVSNALEEQNTLLYDNFTFWFCQLYKSINPKQSEEQKKEVFDSIARRSNLKLIIEKLDGVDYEGGVNVSNSRSIGIDTHIRFPEINTQYKVDGNKIPIGIKIRINPFFESGSSEEEKHFSKIWVIVYNTIPVDYSGRDLAEIFRELNVKASELEVLTKGFCIPEIVYSRDVAPEYSLLFKNASVVNPSLTMDLPNLYKNSLNGVVAKKILKEHPTMRARLKDILRFQQLSADIEDNDKVLTSALGCKEKENVWQITHNCPTDKSNQYNLVYKLVFGDNKTDISGIGIIPEKFNKREIIYSMFRDIAQKYSWGM